MKKLSLKKTALSLSFLLFSFSAQAGFFGSSNSCEELSMQDYKNGMAPRPIFDAKTGNESFDYVEAKDGIGRLIPELPKTYREIFFDGKDFADQVIAKNAEESDQYWSQDLSKEQVDEFRSHDFDHVVFRELNLKAGHVWKNLVNCNGGSIQLARLNYFRGSPCDKAPENKQLVLELKELNENYTNFVKSTGLIKYKNYKQDALEIPHQHPLLVQIELQVLAVTINSEAERMNEAMYRAQQYEYELSDKYFRENKYLKAASEERVRAFHANGVVSWYNMMVNSAIMASSHTRAAVAGLPNFCSQFGLWPAMNRSILYFIRPYRNSYNSSLEGIKSVGKIITDQLSQCGHNLEPLQAGFGSYSRFSLSHLFESKRMFGLYWNEKTSPEFSKVVDKNNTTPFQNMICTE